MNFVINWKTNLFFDNAEPLNRENHRVEHRVQSCVVSGLHSNQQIFMLSLAFKNISRLPPRKRWPWFKNDTKSILNVHAFSSPLQIKLTGVPLTVNPLSTVCHHWRMCGPALGLEFFFHAYHCKTRSPFPPFSSPCFSLSWMKIEHQALISVSDHGDSENIIACLSIAVSIIQAYNNLQ